MFSSLSTSDREKNYLHFGYAAEQWYRVRNASRILYYTRLLILHGVGRDKLNAQGFTTYLTSIKYVSYADF